MSQPASDWRVANVGDLGRIVTGKTPPSSRSELFGSDFPFITPTDIQQGQNFVETGRFLSNEGAKFQHTLLLPKEAVCFVCIGATIGKICMTSQPSFTNQQINSIIVDRRHHDPRFVYHLLRHNADRIKSIAGGAATPIVNKSAFSSVEVAVPPLPIQNRIGFILSAYDDLIQNNNRRIKILEEMARMIYREWFVNFRFPGHDEITLVDSPVGPIPHGWQVMEFRNLFNIKYGKTLPKSEIAERGPYPVYGAGDVIGYYDRPLCSKKSVLVTSRGNGSGTVWRTREAAFVTNNSLIIEPQAQFNCWEYSFIELLLRHSNVMQAKTGTAQPQVTIENLNYVNAVVPSKKVVEHFCAFTTPIYDYVDVLVEKCRNLRHTRDFLLPKVISGEISVESLETAAIS